MKNMIILFLPFMIVIVFAIYKKHYKQYPNSVKRNTKNNKYTKSNNCNGCIKQDTCQYGYYTYDPIDKRQLSLWEKYIMLSVNLKSDTTSRPKEINMYINQYSNQKNYTSNDIEWLLKYLYYEQNELKKIADFGKCGKAYIKYMKLDSFIHELEYKIKNITK